MAIALLLLDNDDVRDVRKALQGRLANIVDGNRSASYHRKASGTVAAPPRSTSSRMLWAQLVARIYEVLPLLCPACGGEMRIISFITLPATVQRILLHLDLPHRPPRVSPARDPPQAELDLDQSPAFDP